LLIVSAKMNNQMNGPGMASDITLTQSIGGQNNSSLEPTHIINRLQYSDSNSRSFQDQVPKSSGTAQKSTMQSIQKSKLGIKREEMKANK